MTSKTSNNVSAAPSGCYSTNVSMDFSHAKYSLGSAIFATFVVAPILILIIAMFFLDSYFISEKCSNWELLKNAIDDLAPYPSMIVTILITSLVISFFVSLYITRLRALGKLNSTGLYINSIYHFPLSKLLKFRLQESSVEIVTPEGSFLVLQNQTTQFLKWFVSTGNRILANLKGTDHETNVWDMVSDISKSPSDTINSSESNSPADNQTNPNNNDSERINFDFLAANQEKSKSTGKDSRRSEFGNTEITNNSCKTPPLRKKTQERFDRYEQINQVDKPEKTYCNWNVNNDSDSVTLIMKKPSFTFSDIMTGLKFWLIIFACLVFGSIFLIVLGWFALQSRFYIKGIEYYDDYQVVNYSRASLTIFEVFFAAGILAAFETIVLLVVSISVFLYKVFFEAKTQHWTITSEKATLGKAGSSTSKGFSMTNFAYMEIQKIIPPPEIMPTSSQSESSSSPSDSLKNADEIIQYQLVLFDNEDCEIFSFNKLNVEEAHWLAGMIMPVLSK